MATSVIAVDTTPNKFKERVVDNDVSSDVSADPSALACAELRKIYEDPEYAKQKRAECEDAIDKARSIMDTIDVLMEAREQDTPIFDMPGEIKARIGVKRRRSAERRAKKRAKTAKGASSRLPTSTI